MLDYFKLGFTNFHQHILTELVLTGPSIALLAALLSALT